MTNENANTRSITFQGTKKRGLEVYDLSTAQQHQSSSPVTGMDELVRASVEFKGRYDSQLAPEQVRWALEHGYWNETHMVPDVLSIQGSSLSAKGESYATNTGLI